ncbi:MAG: TIGR00282 family metallophosphoesterase [Clostridia bacterium]|nr:TIGR00282 family metallophosphoesterase [Clostridia bacterium]
MNIFLIGDVCGRAGCSFLRKALPSFKKNNNIDLVIANGENSADGNGITPQSANHLFESGVDVITGGNHSLRRKEVYSLLDENAFVLRPHNVICDFGKGYTTVDMGKLSVAVLNISGKVYLNDDSIKNPFETADELVEKAKADGVKIIVVDFHAEATSEKRAFGIYLDGKASVVFGTHTHVQTADEQILKNGTAYITDLGMTGPEDSVLGVKSSIIIDRFKNNKTDKFVLSDSACYLCGLVVNIDEKSGKALSVKRVILR